jgi:hypothetical protein
MRTSILLGIPLTFLLLALGVANLEARIIVHWSAQDLFDKSDLVIIATPTATGDTLEQKDLPGIAQLTPDNKTIGVPAVGVETKFRIAGVLKGDKNLTKVTMHHYRLKEAVKAGINDPHLLFFNPEDKAEFLLFLVREADGRYAPTSGQTDPGLYSVRSLGSPDGIQLPVIPSGGPKGKR